MAKGGKIQGLSEAVDALGRELVKTKTQLEIVEGTLKEDGKRIEGARRGVTDVSHSLGPADRY